MGCNPDPCVCCAGSNHQLRAQPGPLPAPDATGTEDPSATQAHSQGPGTEADAPDAMVVDASLHQLLCRFLPLHVHLRELGTWVWNTGVEYGGSVISVILLELCSWADSILAAYVYLKPFVLSLVTLVTLTPAGPIIIHTCRVLDSHLRHTLTAFRPSSG